MATLIYTISLLILANYYARVLSRWHVQFKERWYQMTHEERIDLVTRWALGLLLIYVAAVHP